MKIFEIENTVLNKVLTNFEYPYINRKVYSMLQLFSSFSIIFLYSIRISHILFCVLGFCFLSVSSKLIGHFENILGIAYVDFATNKRTHV